MHPNSTSLIAWLQALLHAPVLRSFYLGGGHLREACRWSSPAEPCLSCELVRLCGRPRSLGWSDRFMFLAMSWR